MRTKEEIKNHIMQNSAASLDFIAKSVWEKFKRVVLFERSNDEMFLWLYNSKTCKCLGCLRFNADVFTSGNGFHIER